MGEYLESRTKPTHNISYSKLLFAWNPSTHNLFMGTLDGSWLSKNEGQIWRREEASFKLAILNYTTSLAQYLLIKWDECNVNIYWHIVSNEYDKKNSQLIDIGIF
jgi:hypothetical protein